MNNLQCQFLIPPTTPTHYITGVYALNLHPPNNTSGDWHFGQVFYYINENDFDFSVQLAGEDEFCNTNPIYGDYGIYEGIVMVKKLGLIISPEITEIYIANHFRAILDMLYKTIKKYGREIGLQCATDEFLDTTEQKEEVLSQSLKMKPYLTVPEQLELDKWIVYERTNEYWNGKG